MRRRKLSLWEATSIAVGIIIGASIFSILGVGAQIAGKDLPLAFILSSLAAYFVAYNYAKLGSKFISNAGPIEFILQGIGDNELTGTLAFLMWMSYVVSLSLFANAFSGYFLALIEMEGSAFLFGLTETMVVVAFTALNFFGSKTVGKTESFIVLGKLLVLGVFVFGGLWFIKPDYIAPELDVEHLMGAVYAATIFFLSYTGFGLITNASEDIENPEKNVPRAIYLSLLIVTVVYVSIATVAVGNLPIQELVKAKEYALAEAAKPFLGNLGFIFISIGALFSTSSATNATIYGGANIAYALAKDGELPPIFERKTWFSASEGLYITAGLGLLFALLFDINGIAAICSATFLLVYIFAIISHLRLIDQTKARKSLVGLSLVVVLVIFSLLMYYQWQTDRRVFYTIWVTVAIFAIIEFIYRRITKRSLLTRPQTLSKYEIESKDA